MIKCWALDTALLLNDVQLEQWSENGDISALVNVSQKGLETYNSAKWYWRYSECEVDITSCEIGYTRSSLHVSDCLWLLFFVGKQSSIEFL